MIKIKKILNKKILHFSLVLVLGLFLGWFIFKGEKSETHEIEMETDAETIWTCSMCPQVRQQEPGKCPICGMDLIPLEKNESEFGDDPFIYEISAEAIALANIQTTRLIYASPEHEINLTGKIGVNEQRLAVITADFSGRIEKLYVDYTGQTVEAGEKLAGIYSPELITAQKELLEAKKYKETMPTLYYAAKEKLRLLKITDTQINSIIEKGEVVTEFDVYAYKSGIVLKRKVSKGDYVSIGNTLFEIADLSEVWVLVDAYERDIPWIHVGQNLKFTLAANPGKEYNSKVIFIEPVINPKTRTVIVRAEANNKNMELKPEMFVNAKINVKTSISAEELLIPKTALLWTGKRSVVYVKVPHSDVPAFEMREIILGSSTGDFYIVKDGLTQGEEIVTNGVFALDAAAQLRGQFSMMNRPESMRIEVPDDFKIQLNDLVSQYFIIKNALVESDYSKTLFTTEKMLSLLESVNMNLLDDKAMPVWMELEKNLEESISKITSADEIEKQRKIFHALSKDIIEISEKFGIKKDVVYVQHCPMAFDDKGAVWLNEIEKIENPYFGDAMLRCGSIEKRIRALDSYKTKTETPDRKEGGPHHHH